LVASFLPCRKAWFFVRSHDRIGDGRKTLSGKASLVALIREDEPTWEEPEMLREMNSVEFDDIGRCYWNWTQYVPRDIRAIWRELSVEARLLVCRYALELQSQEDMSYDS
jgi:hypothetical protein